MHRRRLLQLMAAAPSRWAPAALRRAGRADNRLLVVFMRGAYDAASLLVPAASDFYYESRPTIAIPAPAAAADAALPLADGWALHPALAASLMPFYQRRELAFLPFAGTGTPAAAISRRRTASSWARGWTRAAQATAQAF